MSFPSQDATPARTTGADFETMPYTSHPFADTRPSHLAAIAGLLGFPAPDPRKARVVELGCASGGNIIPMAAQFPEARFLGIDLSPRHVDLARDRIAALGLTNIEVQQGDLGEPGIVDGEWDYALCHGVFSWVGPDVQAQILQTCHDCLSDRGLAYISYNVLPGWQLRKVVRDIFLFDDDPLKGAPERVARGRWLLEQLAEGTAEDSQYGQLLRSEVQTLSRQPDSYIMAEFLVDENLPCYFHDFAARAKAAGLGYLGESKLTLNAPGASNPKLDEKLRTLAGPDQVMYEQYHDFLTGRQFRQSILFRAAPNAGYRRDFEAGPLTAMHFAAQLQSSPVEGKPGAMHVRKPDGMGFSTNDPAVAAVFDHMAECYPATRSPRQLLDHLATLPDLDRNNLSQRVMQALMRTAMAGLVTAGQVPVRCGTGKEARPTIWPLARQELKTGQTWVTTLAHTPVGLDAASRRMAPLLDGTRDRAAIEAEVRTILETEADSLGLLNVTTTDPQTAAQYAGQFIDQCARLGLLLPDPD